ncbi:NAD(P)H-dependent oxidoreductase [Flavobacteriaceae bacterium GSB9]|nr:NAD(P)H-dependent oxidoreductase [Flavobacteriaceae bacterium GSB9]
MKKIIAFAGSNSKNSINKQLVTYASSLLEDTKVELLDLNDFELPLYGIDLENEAGIPKNAHKFLSLIKESDGIFLSLAEHNGAYSTVFKNLFDWMSRIESKTFFGKPMLLMAASPGGRGGASVLEIAQSRFPFHNAEIVEVFSLPFFGDNFEAGEIIDDKLNIDLKRKVEAFENILENANTTQV